MEQETKRYRVVLHVEVNHEELALHDGSKAPPPNNVADWYGGDLNTACDLGIAEIEHSEIEMQEVGG